MKRVVFSTTTKFGDSSAMIKSSRSLNPSLKLHVRTFIVHTDALGLLRHNLEECKWDRPVATLQVTGHPLCMAFHAYDKHLIIANESDMIT
jgi:hypothetical protein